jgi:hypothetical protein
VASSQHRAAAKWGPARWAHLRQRCPERTEGWHAVDDTHAGSDAVQRAPQPAATGAPSGQSRAEHRATGVLGRPPARGLRRAVAAAALGHRPERRLH